MHFPARLSWLSSAGAGDSFRLLAFGRSFGTSTSSSASVGEPEGVKFSRAFAPSGSNKGRGAVMTLSIMFGRWPVSSSPGSVVLVWGIISTAAGFKGDVRGLLTIGDDASPEADLT